MITNIVFSKDRPWQLSEYLRTREKYIKGISDTIIIYKSSNDQTKNRYHKLFKKYNNIKAFHENDLHDFATLLETAIKNSAEYILFGVDDVLFYRQCDLSIVHDLFSNQYKDLFSLSLRLGKNINWCQPANIPSNIQNIGQVNNLIFYHNQLGTGDWNYPFEVSASIYKKQDVIDLLNIIREKEGVVGYSHPNKFEGAGSIVVSNLNFLNACFVENICSTITVNRVQDIYLNSLAGDEVTIDQANALFDSENQFDDKWYAEQQFNQIHIGHFKCVK
jgi:hypothetical protein